MSGKKSPKTNVVHEQGAGKGKCTSPAPSVNNNVPTILIQHRIFVGNLQPDVTEEHLCSVFAKEGEIKDCKVIRDQDKSKGYGFITFKDESTVAKILAKPPGRYSFKGRFWNVSSARRRFSHTRSPSPSSPASGAHMYVPNQFDDGMFFVYPYTIQNSYGVPVHYPPQNFAYPYPGNYYIPSSPYTPSPTPGQNQFMFPPVYGIPYEGQEEYIDYEGQPAFPDAVSPNAANTKDDS